MTGRHRAGSRHFSRLQFNPRQPRHFTVRSSLNRSRLYLSVETGRGQWTVSV